MRLTLLGLTYALLHWQHLIAQTTRVQDLSLNVDTTLKADLKLHLLRSEVTVAAGERWEGTFTLYYADTIPLSQPVLATLIYENRGTYLSLAQPIGKLDKLVAEALSKQLH